MEMKLEAWQLMVRKVFIYMGLVQEQPGQSLSLAEE